MSGRVCVCLCVQDGVTSTRLTAYGANDAKGMVPAMIIGAVSTVSRPVVNARTGATASVHARSLCSWVTRQLTVRPFPR